jgi:hypothetical protein
VASTCHDLEAVSGVVLGRGDWALEDMMALSKQQPTETSNRTLYIKIGIIVVCIAGGAAGYFLQSHTPEVKMTPEVVEAEGRAEEIQKKLEEAPLPPAAPEVERTKPRSLLQAPGG